MDAVKKSRREANTFTPILCDRQYVTKTYYRSSLLFFFIRSYKTIKFFLFHCRLRRSNTAANFAAAALDVHV